MALPSSLALMVLSVATALMTGLAAVVSRVKVRLPLLDTLPAASVWRTCTVWRPSVVAPLNWAPLPVFQAPLSIW